MIGARRNTLKIATIRIRRLAKRWLLFGRLDGLSAWLATKVDRGTAGATSPPVGNYRVRLVNGLEMTIPRRSPSADLVVAGLYEPDMTQLLTELLSSGMTVVDVGANVGYYSLLASTLVGPSGRVFAFEPDVESYSYLEANARSNGCMNVLTARAAVSSTVGQSFFNRLEPERGFLTRSPEEHAPSSANLEAVATTTLDHFFAAQGWPHVHLVKMDIEGAESEALAGMHQLSERNPNLKLLLEFNLDAIHRAGATTPLLIASLRQLGFRVARVIEKDLAAYPLSDTFPVSHIVYNLLVTKE